MFKLKELNKKYKENAYKSNINTQDNNTNPQTNLPTGNNFNENATPDKFKGSAVIRNATENLFLNNNNSLTRAADKDIATGNTVINSQSAKSSQTNSANSGTTKRIFSNTFNFAESVISLHESINNNNSNERNTVSTFFNNNNHSHSLNPSHNHLTIASNKPHNDAYLKDNLTSFKSVSMYPSLVTPQLKKVNHGDNFPQDKQAINLEDLFIQEEKLWSILESLRYNTNTISFSCEDYFEFLNVTSLQSLDAYFQTYETKIQTGVNNVLEIFSVMCGMISVIKKRLDEVTITHLKNLLFNVHQNFLLLVNLVLVRLPSEYESNVWADRLKKIVNRKQINYMGNDNEPFFLLKQNNKLILNSAVKFISANLKNKNDIHIYEVLQEVLENCEKYTYSTVKNIMFNLKNSLMHFSLMNQSALNFPVIPAPYLPPLPDDKKNTTYTLVLDLDETLVHYINQTNGGDLLIRPGTEKFLEEMSNYYEIVVFTAALQDYADWILDSLDTEKKFIKHRLYRHHASINKNTYVKDISKLGRDLTKTIIIDNVWENFQLQPENGIFIKTWLEDKADSSLIDLMPLLKDLVTKKVPDVRKTLRKFRDTMLRLFVKGDTNPYKTLAKSLNGNSE